MRGRATLASMSGEIIAIIAVGIALAGLGWRAIWRLDRRIDRAEDARRADMQRMEDARRADMKRMEDAHRADMQALKDGLGGRMDRIEERLARVEHGQAKLEGLLEGLRDAISGRRAA